MRRTGSKYLARSRALAEAIDLSMELYAALTAHERDAMVKHALDCKMRALAPEPAFANLRSLAYLEVSVLTYWNEASGEHIERFWQLVAERRLPFQREDVVREVLSRGRIHNDIEYQTALESHANYVPRQTVYAEVARDHIQTGSDFIVMRRCRDWKLVVYLDDDNGELYDLRSDPGETTNLWHRSIPQREKMASDCLRWARWRSQGQTAAHPRAAARHGHLRKRS